MVAFCVILTFLAFILGDAALQWAEASRERRRTNGREPAPVRGIPLVDAIAIPRGFFAGPGHTWVGLEPSGQVRIGMDRFAGAVIGRIDAVDLPQEGSRVLRGDPLFTVCQGTRKATFVAPVDGEIAAVNRAAAEDPRGLASDPYHKGWICTLTPANIGRNLREMFIAEEAREWLKGEARRIQDLIASGPLRTAEAGAVMSDGGQVTSGILEALDDETWALFAKEFLLSGQ